MEGHVEGRKGQGRGGTDGWDSNWDEMLTAELGGPLTFSCTLTSWNLVNFDPLVCRHSRPPDLFFWHSLLGHITRGMKVGEAIWGGVRGRVFPSQGCTQAPPLPND